MSVSHNGQMLKCDGPGCAASARAPVALRSTLGRGADTSSSSVYGWLYVVREGRWTHFCPKCNTAYLDAMANDDRGKRTRL